MKRRRTRRRRARRRRTRGGGVIDFMLGGFVRNQEDPKTPPNTIEPLQIKCMEAFAADAKKKNKKIVIDDLTYQCGKPNVMWKPGILDQLLEGKYPINIAAHYANN